MMTQFKVLEYSVYRNSIMYVFDSLSNSLNWHGVGHAAGRIILKDALSKATEQDAKQYLEIMYKQIGVALGKQKYATST